MQQSLTQRVALALKLEMVRQGLSAPELAERMNRNYLWLSRRLRGDVVFDLADLEAISAALAVPVTALFIEERVA